MKEWGFRAPFPHRPSRTRRRTHHYLPLSKPFFDFPRMCIQQSTEAASQSAYFSSAVGVFHEGGCRVAATRWAPGTWRSGSRVGHEARQPRCALPGGADPAGSRGISGCGGCSCARGRSFQKGKRLHQRGNPYFFHCSFITRLSACSTSHKQLTVTVPK